MSFWTHRHTAMLACYIVGIFGGLAATTLLSFWLLLKTNLIVAPVAIQITGSIAVVTAGNWYLPLLVRVFRLEARP